MQITSLRFCYYLVHNDVMYLGKTIFFLYRRDFVVGLSEYDSSISCKALLCFVLFTLARREIIYSVGDILKFF